MYSLFYTKFYAPIINRLKGLQVTKHLNGLMHSQWLSFEEIKALQFKKLKRLVIHAYNNVPYYHSLFKSINLKPQDVQTFRDLQKIPLLTKKKIQDNYEDLIALNFDHDMHKNATGGSTGEPLIFYQNKLQREMNGADQCRCLRFMRVNPGDKCAYLWGAERDHPIMTWKGKINVIISRKLWLNSFKMSSEQMNEFFETLNQFQPKGIIGYASSLEFFSKYLTENNLSLKFTPLGVQSSAEKLQKPQRELISSIFGCLVYDRYGCREVGNIACECAAHEGLHISAERIYVEFVREGQHVSEGETGKIVVTDLTNYAMPFIRYENGDVGTPVSETCSCGRGLPLMKPPVGRISDIFVLPTGEYIHGEFFTHLFYGVRGVKRFQVIQKSTNEITLKIVAAKGFDHDTLYSIEKEITDWLGSQVQIDFRIVDSILPTPSGKYLFTMSKVQESFDC